MAFRRVVVISHRQRLGLELARIIGREIIESSSPLLSDLYETRLHPPPAFLVDVLELFPGSIVRSVPAAPREWPHLLVVGYSDDVDAVLAALNHGIDVQILEHLAPGVLAGMATLSGPRRELYGGVGRIMGESVHRLLVERSMRPPLTPRELEILDLLKRGYGNAQIARMLQVAPKTVKNHTTRLYAKLGVTNRHEAAVLG